MRTVAGRARPRQRQAQRCWVWELRDGGTLVAQGREPTRDKALRLACQRARERTRTGPTPANFSGHLIYLMSGGRAHERVPIATLLGDQGA